MHNASTNAVPMDALELRAYTDKKRQARQMKTVVDGVAMKASEGTLLSLNGIWKVFDGVSVLCGVSMDLKPGEIHAILGGNGSGKSTLMKILSGIYQMDDGSIELEGKPVVVKSPAHGHQLGIYMVPQEPQVFPHLSVEENLLMGINLPHAEAIGRIQEYSEELGFLSNLGEEAGTLSIASQQLMEILRGLLHNARVLIFDEPTSSLTFREVDSLFAILKKLTARGIGIFFISHRLNEILTISDRISVLRDGFLVLSESTSKLTSGDLIRAMVPDTNTGAVSGTGSIVDKARQFGNVVLELKDLTGDSFHGINLKVQAGEVVGLAGVVGAGRTEIAHGIIGIDPNVRGEVWINGKLAKNRCPNDCQDLGLVYVPEDRHAHGIFLELPNVLTITASILPKLGKILLSAMRERELGQSYISQLSIKVNGLTQISRTLSGGNQQKIVLSKALASSPNLIILDEPTRGVDAKARQDVYSLIHALTEKGAGILLISSDLDEITQLSDRVLVMYHGSIFEELSQNDRKIDRITAAAFGEKGAL